MDELKKYLHQQRSKLDTDEPGDMVWQNVKQALHPKKATTISLYIKWAAAACLILVAGATIYFLQKDTGKGKMDGPVVADSNRSQPVTPNQPGITTSPGVVVPEKKIQPVIVKANPPIKKRKSLQPARAKKDPPRMYGFEGVEASYASMLGIQLERLRTQPIYAEDADYFHSFKKQFADLSNEEESIKNRVRENGMRDDYLDQLISIYQKKINVLKQLQLEINKMNNRVKKADPSINQQTASYINL
jgi:hypothetical protein